MEKTIKGMVKESASMPGERGKLYLQMVSQSRGDLDYFLRRGPFKAGDVVELTIKTLPKT